MTEEEKMVWASAFGYGVAYGYTAAEAAMRAAKAVRLLRSPVSRTNVETQLTRGSEAMQMFDDMRRM